MGSRKRNRHFTDEFKMDALQLVLEKGMSVGKVARDLDIHPNLLGSVKNLSHFLSGDLNLVFPLSCH